MSTGIALATIKNIRNNKFSVIFETIQNIKPASGVTKLVNAYVWFILSSYNSTTKTGSKLPARLASALISSKDNERVAIELTDDIIEANERFKYFQSESYTDLPNDELLDDARILGITTDPNTGTISIDLEVIARDGSKGRFTL